MKTKLLFALAACGVALGAASAQDMPLSQIIKEGEGWRPIKAGYARIIGLIQLPGGIVTVYHEGGSDRIRSDGRVAQSSGEVVAAPAQVRTNRGFAYVIRGEPPRVSLLGKNRPNIDASGISRPAGLALSPDESTLFIGDSSGRAVWAFRIEADGRLSCGEPYCPLRLPPGKKESGVSALASDAAGRIYAATPLGVQVFDPTGRLCGVLAKPANAELTALAFGGKDLDTLHVACGDGVYARKMLAKGRAHSD